MKEGRSAPWFQSGWSRRPRDSGNVCGEEAGILSVVLGSIHGGEPVKPSERGWLGPICI